MTVGITTTGALADSLNDIIVSARIVREYEGIMPGVVDKQTLPEGSGLDWNEISLGQLTAQAVTETTELDNPQQIADTLFSITPTVIGIHTVITDRVKKRIAPIVYAKIGALSQNAIQRKKDEDGITVLDGGTSLCGAGVTLSSGYITAAATRIQGNATEPGKPPINCVLHPYQVKDLLNELVSGVGTFPVDESGITARAFRDAYVGKIGGVNIFSDGNITVDASSDAKGGVFAKEAIVLVQGRSPWVESERKPNLGGGADVYYVYDEYAYGERSAGNWLFEIYSDATAPTS